MEAAITRMIIALSLTILLELLAFWLFIKSHIPENNRRLWVVFIIGLNLFTNPLAHFFYFYLSDQIVTGLSWIISETLVIVIEAILIKFIMRESLKKAIIYSLILNSTSIILGEIILWFL